MDIGEKIRALRAHKQKLKEELCQTEQLLLELESSCTHKNTTKGIVVILPDDPNPIRIPTIKCLDCGTHKVIPKTTRGIKK